MAWSEQPLFANFGHQRKKRPVALFIAVGGQGLDLVLEHKILEILSP
jgi:hypothetical protein